MREAVIRKGMMVHAGQYVTLNNGNRGYSRKRFTIIISP